MLKIRLSLVILLAALTVGVTTPGSPAASVPANFTVSVVASGLAAPTSMDFAPDGRLFVCEQGGSLRVIKNGALLPTPFLTLPVDSSGERGLLGVAFDPNFAAHPYVYVYYTATSPATHNRVSRFTANGDVAVAGSETPLLDLTNLSAATNHNGGAIHFGSDGYLYIAAGDNASGSNSQSMTNLLGKILRIAPDGSIPSSNPFYNTTTGVNRAIWVYGLRNPYTFAFQRGGSRMFINDVGQSTWEEINVGIQGSNYGWPTTEGYTNDSRYVNPIFEYGHGSGNTLGCAITGGTFYDCPSPQFPLQYRRQYFFSDYCNGWIRMLDPANNTVSLFATGLDSPVDLKVGPDSALYYLSHGGGGVNKIQYPNTSNSWQTADISVGADNQVHLLWGSAGGQYGIWNVDSSFNPTRGPAWGPMQGWSAGAVSTGGDGLTRMLWTNNDDRAGLWTSDSSFKLRYGPVWGPFPGWTATDIASGTNGLTSLLWTNSDGRAGLWIVDGSFNYSPGPSWGPFPGWIASAVASGADGLTRLLWTNTNGQAGLWTVNPSFNYTPGTAWRATPGWTAVDIAVDNSNVTYVLWTKTDGSLGLWKVDSQSNPIAYGPVWGPYPGWTARRVTAGGSDGTVKILLVNQDGHMGYWSVDGGFNVTGGPAYGPY